MAQFNAIWLPDALASERPASPGKGRYLFRATDSGAISYWDGSAWRAVHNPTVNAVQLQGRAVAATAPTGGQVLMWNDGAAQWEPATIADDTGRTIDPMDGTGWTSLTPASGATTTWAAGVLTLAIPASTTVSSAAGVERADALAESDAYDLLVRLDVVLGDAAASPNTGNLYLLVGRDANNCFVFAMNGDGSLSIGRTSGGVWGGAYVSPAANTITSGQRTGGQLWHRVSRRPGAVIAAFGVGSAGAVPTAWTTLYSDTGANYDALDLSCGTFARIGADTFGAGVGAGWTVDVLAIRTCAQSGAPL